MKKFIFMVAVFSSLMVNGNTKTEMTRFYEEFLCNEKRELHHAGLGPSCTFIPFDPNHPIPPPNPGPPQPMPGFLPIVIVNNSSLPDDEVYIVVTGKDEATSTQSFVQFAGNGAGTLIFANPSENALQFSKTLAQFPETNEGRVFYLPKIKGGAIWFSMVNPLNMPVNAPDLIVQPNFTSSADSNYYTNFDIFEVTYISTGTNISADATAVSFFSIPLYGFISTPAPGTSSNTGLFHPRSFVMSHAETVLGSAVEASQWNSLFLRNGSTILRLLSPGKAMAASIFDSNYLDNAASYGYSYINDIWSSLSSFYRIHPLVLTIPNGTLDTYTGVINLDNTITFTGSTFGHTIVLAAPTTTTPSTTYDIFSGLFFIVSDNSPGAADGIQLSKLFEEAIITGLVPTANTLSNPYLTSNQSIYYTINPNLTGSGPSTGPWFDLYSKALHALGFIYTFAYDEPLWPQVQIKSDTLLPNTYIGITIGNVQ